MLVASVLVAASPAKRAATLREEAYNELTVAKDPFLVFSTVLYPVGIGTSLSRFMPGSKAWKRFCVK